MGRRWAPAAPLVLGALAVPTLTGAFAGCADKRSGHGDLEGVATVPRLFERVALRQALALGPPAQQGEPPDSRRRWLP